MIIIQSVKYQYREKIRDIAWAERLVEKQLPLLLFGILHLDCLLPVFKSFQWCNIIYLAVKPFTSRISLLAPLYWLTSASILWDSSRTAWTLLNTLTSAGLGFASVIQYWWEMEKPSMQQRELTFKIQEQVVALGWEASSLLTWKQT